MSDTYRFYEARGFPGYIHSACWFAFERANTTYDDRGEVVFKPVPISAMKTIGRRAGQRLCVHCHEPLIEKSVSQTEGYFNLIRRNA